MVSMAHAIYVDLNQIPLVEMSSIPASKERIIRPTARVVLLKPPIRGNKRDAIPPSKNMPKISKWNIKGGRVIKVELIMFSKILEINTPSEALEGTGVFTRLLSEALKPMTAIFPFTMGGACLALKISTNGYWGKAS
jgi:hypothetical protein